MCVCHTSLKVLIYPLNCLLTLLAPYLLTYFLVIKLQCVKDRQQTNARKNMNYARHYGKQISTCGWRTDVKRRLAALFNEITADRRVDSTSRSCERDVSTVAQFSICRRATIDQSISSAQSTTAGRNVRVGSAQVSVETTGPVCDSLGIADERNVLHKIVMLPGVPLLSPLSNFRLSWATLYTSVDRPTRNILGATVLRA